MERYINNINIAFEAILANKLKSALTALGIICGVAAVISMMAIGKGAKQEIIEQLSLVGVNNIIINPVQQDANDISENVDNDAKKVQKKYSPGLTIEDYKSIKEIIPTVKIASPEISFNTVVVKDGKRTQKRLSGINSDYFNIYSLKPAEGKVFTKEQEEKGLAVCIIGGNIKTNFFSSSNPLGQYIKCGNLWLKVIGVLGKNYNTKIPSEEIGISLMDDRIFIPVKTMLLRVRNRGLINEGRQNRNVKIMQNPNTNKEYSKEKNNYNQLDQIIVQVKETNQLVSSANIINRMLLRRHQGIKDFEITIPELLLKQQQKTKDIFNIVLGAIAGISLIVGGIGIMNIMFSSVLERISEIGIRLAVGANKKDIIFQFLSESILISVSGGFIGILSGIILSKLITHFTGIDTIITLFSVCISFGVSVAVGVIFGYSPAKKASEKNPIESLRYE